MTTVFVAGSIKIKELDDLVKDRLDKIIDSDFSIIVGDADGADASVQKYLLSKHADRTIVFHSGAKPRNNLGHWFAQAVRSHFKAGSREFYTAKDLEMAKAADYGLMIWDGESTGTLSNVIELLKQDKKSIVYLTNSKSFVRVTDVEKFELLIAGMTDRAKSTANRKIGLQKALDRLRDSQVELFN